MAYHMLYCLGIDGAYHPQFGDFDPKVVKAEEKETKQQARREKETYKSLILSLDNPTSFQPFARLNETTASSLFNDACQRIINEANVANPYAVAYALVYPDLHTSEERAAQALYILSNQRATKRWAIECSMLRVAARVLGEVLYAR